MVQRSTSPEAARRPVSVSPTERVAIVVSRYNADVTSRLLDGALATLREHGLGEDRILTIDVPGAFEIPLAADRLAHSGRYTAVVCLGAVIQGETMHHEYINQQVAAAIMRISLETGIPVAFGVLTCQTLDQALARAGGAAGNKGREAALAALDMITILRQIAT